MRADDLDALFPDRVWTYARGEHAATTLIPATVTHLARLALGLPTEDVPRDTMVAAITECLETNRYTEFGTPRWHGAMAVCATYLGDWDLVARCTGGKMLGTQIYATRTFGADTQAFARHLATIVHARQPAIKAATAMNELRDRFMRGELDDARVAPIAAAVFIRDLVLPDTDLVVATRRWLDGEELELDVGSKATAAIADGEDPRVKIFERYAAELADELGIDRELAAVRLPPWSRDVEHDRRPVDDLVVRAYVARRPLFEGWERVVDPAVAAWLGAVSTHDIEQRFRDLALLHRGGQLKYERGWDDVVQTLSAGNHDSVLYSTGRDMLVWKPGRFFKDDGRKLLRYVATAIAQGGTVADVEPAWADFLARRSPATTPLIEAGRLRWKHLLAIQAAITHVLGKAPRGEVGAALRRAIADAR